MEKLYSSYNAKIKYELVCNSTYSSDLLCYTNGSHKGFVEFCVIEVFKLGRMEEPKLGYAPASQAIIQK